MELPETPNYNKIMLMSFSVVVVAVVVLWVYAFAWTSSGTGYSQYRTITIGQNISSPAQLSPAVSIAYNTTVGSYLVNSTGWTLYLYTNDKPNSGTSACYGICATFWKPFYAASLTVQSGINASAFGTITRTDGSKQTTYMGWPLYYYLGDKAAGEISGQGSDGSWFVVTVPTLRYT